MKKSETNWTNFSLEKVKDNYPIWPIEVMAKVLFGDYLRGEKPTLNSTTKVLEVGCGFGNNLLPFLVKGCKCYGVEITDEMAQLARNILQNRGFTGVEIKTGTNRSLPFENEEFDLIISNNVIHYEKDEKNYLGALKEYARVMRSGGGLFLMTVGPSHDIYTKAKIKGSHQFEIQNWDFRDGEQYFYVSNLNYLKHYLSMFFNNIELGQVTENLMKVNLDFLFAYCHKA